MIPFLIPALLCFQGGTIALDSAGLRRPQLHLPEIGSSWSPPVLRDRLILDIGAGPQAAKARSSLKSLSASFTGDWKNDFGNFRKAWPRSLSDGTWPILVSAFWRTRPDQELQTSPGLRGSAAVGMLQEWVRWLETTDLKVRFSLADATSQELSEPGSTGASHLLVGDSLRLDLTRAKFDGPVRIRIEQLVRRGASIADLQAMEPVPTWAPPAARPVWTSKPWKTPGLFRVVWEAKGFYQQALVHVGNLGILGIPTDSGMLVWASTPSASSSRLVWKTKTGKVDSATLDLSSPVHLGFGPESDSALVAVVSGREFTTLRLHRGRPLQQERLGLSEERDRYGRPLLTPPRIAGGSGWQAASVLERDAFEKGEMLRVSGWMRHLDAYGRPDLRRGDSLQWSLDPFSGSPTRRWVKPDSNGIWRDSAVVALKGQVRVTALAAGGDAREDAFCEAGSLYRVRDKDNSCLDGRESAPLPKGPTDTASLDISGKSGLLILAQGRALDWAYPVDANDNQVRVAATPAMAGGASALIASPSPTGWSAWRQSMASIRGCTESRFPLTLSQAVPEKVSAGTPAPALKIAARSQPGPTPMTVFLRLTPEPLAASLKPLCNMLGKAYAASEVYTGDGTWDVWGLKEPDFQDFDKRRDPDIFVRLGVRPFAPVCIACGPWKGSWNPNSGGADLPPSCGWSSPTFPCGEMGAISSFRALAMEARTDADGTVPLAFNWPKSPGPWRLQVWGMDSSGRILAWEQTIQIR